MHKKNLFGLFVLFIILTRAVIADTVALNPKHPDRYVVVKGDTLWDISARFLKNPWHWPDIWQANTQIANPHLIYPGDIIRLVYINGKPRLVIDRSNVVKLSPKGRITPIREAIPTIPLDAILQFLLEPRIVGKDELDKAPYVVEHKGEHLITATNNSIYARGIKGSDIRKYSVVRQGETYVDPKTKEILGYEARFIGNATLYRTGDPSTLRLTRTGREVLVGDRLLPADEKTYDAHFLPRAPGKAVEGVILAVLDGVNQIGRYQVVVINKGKRDGLEPGHVLDVYQAGKVIPDSVTKDRKDTVKLPDEKAGTMMIFRTFEKVSYALIMTSSKNMNVNDIVRNP
jgi:hypothetical protein